MFPLFSNVGIVRMYKNVQKTKDKQTESGQERWSKWEKEEKTSG